MEKEQPLAGLRVLLVEDDDATRAALAALLTSLGAAVAATSTGREAAQLAGAESFTVLVTDLDLPDAPGDAVITEALAASAQRPRVVVLTGAGEQSIVRARHAGADVVLIKPVAFSALVGELRALRETLPTEQRREAMGT
jgi:DNA-binding response OmpR family regulator